MKLDKLKTVQMRVNTVDIHSLLIGKQRNVQVRRSFGLKCACCRLWTAHEWLMSTLHLVPESIQQLYHFKEWRNAAGVLSTACPDEWKDILDVLHAFKLYRTEIEAAGKNRSPISRQIDGAFYERGWIEKNFATSINIDGREYESPTHSVDCFKG